MYTPEKKGGDPFVAVDHITFKLAAGQILGLLGPNGAGKSTTISMLLGVLTPTSGSISYYGKDFSQNRSEILQYVSFSSTYISMPWRLSVWENLQIYALLSNIDRKTFAVRAEKLLNHFGVWEQRNKTMNQLSAGQTTRIMLAKAFIPYPKIALLDEPTASLDPDIAHDVRSFVKEQREKYGTSILYTSHNMDEVSDICDDVLFLRKGKIVAHDTPEKLASSISQTKVRLMVPDGLKRIGRFATERSLPFEITGREVVIEVEEQKIAEFLGLLSREKIDYTQISIDKPTLEDYFLSMSV
ncbi:ABC transporter ATP-binding protein [Candidatus Woesebacteria bacterium]|nr:ABC transporter ATP-binding protein [Candidatus Woesebacteria bacterium]